jgi:metal-dependent amidase/aminoacylase/carboxypeptidase family protein
MEEDGFIIVPMRGDRLPENVSVGTICGYLSDIDHSIESLRPLLWPLNKFIHNNPELAFQEHKAHDAITNFMQSQKGWEVTRSAYGMKTAWVAVYDSGKAGPVVSFNAEMGSLSYTSL